LQVIKTPALTLHKVYHVEIAQSDLHLFCACVRACVYQPIATSVDSFGRI